MLINWDNPQQSILHCRLEQPWSWQDFHKTFWELDDLIQTKTHTVDIIFDFSQSLILPPAALTHLKRLFSEREAATNRGLLVFVECSDYVQIMIRTFTRFNKRFSQEIVFVRTLKEAREILDIDD